MTIERSPLSNSDSSGNQKFLSRLKILLFGHPKDLMDQTIFHRLSLIPFLAWVGLGADGLSSSSYGPEEAFKTLGQNSYVALLLALATGLTVLLISSAYSRIIEQFPHGGGGYVVATKLIGRPAGVISGCALIVDYILTITVSIAASGDALFSFLPFSWLVWKFPVEVLMLIALTGMNIRGVKESVLALAPVFLLFLITHVVAIGGGIIGHAGNFSATIGEVHQGFSQGAATIGVWGIFLIFIRAYTMGGGTYTGLEAVSNGLPIMREPRVKTAKKTMLYMAISLSLTAAGLIFCYLLWSTTFVPGKTMNAVFLEKITASLPYGGTFVVITLLTEGALLVVAAQAGFIDGPRVIANMATDSWFPHRFSALSERLTTQNGVLLMGFSSLLALFYARGNVSHLVVMYSINVFLTFSMSMFGMAKFWWQSRSAQPIWKKRLLLFLVGLLLCSTILVITVIEKFKEGGWITLAVTSCLVVLCLAIHRHYRGVAAKVNKSYPYQMGFQEVKMDGPFQGFSSDEVAAILVSSYSGFGVFTVQNIFRTFPGYFRKIIFLSVGVVDSGGFKGGDSLENLQCEKESMLRKYLEMVAKLKIDADYKMSIGTDMIHEAEKLCKEVAREYPNVIFFSGKVIFPYEGWYHKILHNDAALAIQKRLQWAGLTMVVMPIKVEN